MKQKLRPILPILYMTGILALSSIPGDNNAEHHIHLGWLPSLLQNVLHIPLYGMLAALWFWATIHVAANMRTRALTIAGGCVVFAILDELYQTTVPGRMSSIADIGLDALGTTTGLWCAHLASQRSAIFHKLVGQTTIQK